MSTGNLERVRRIKNRLVRLTTRVQTLREMLEKLMDDDSDMHAMHLTARAYDQLERQVSLSSWASTRVALQCTSHVRHCGLRACRPSALAPKEHDHWAAVQPLASCTSGRGGVARIRVLLEAWPQNGSGACLLSSSPQLSMSSRLPHASILLQKTQQGGFDSALIREQMMAGGPPLSPKTLDEQAERDEEEIAEVEMILETYFMSVDNTFNKLQTLCEYIDDTEVRTCPRIPCLNIACS